MDTENEESVVFRDLMVYGCGILSEASVPLLVLWSLRVVE